MRDRTIVVTGCDEAHFDLAEDLLTSLSQARQGQVRVGFVHIGDARLPEAISARADVLVHLDAQDFHARRRSGIVLCYLGVKARLPELFPGFATYIWLDADTWVQDAAALDNLAEAAQRADVALVPECDVRQFRVPVPSPRTVAIYQQLFPGQDVSSLTQRPMINAGVLAARSDSPLWSKWLGLLDQIRSGIGAQRDIHYSDQIPLHALICREQLSLSPLSALDNWQIWAELPALDLQRRRLTSPYWPFEDIRIVHLAGETKRMSFPIEGGARQTTFRYRDICALFESVNTAETLRPS